MQKIKLLDSLPLNFSNRIYGGSTPKYFHIRFIGKSPSLLRPEIQMDYMIANEFICYGLANLITGINVPEYFLDSYEGNQYFFTRDIDPRPDNEMGLYQPSEEQLNALGSEGVHLASAFNIWTLNRDAADNRNTLIVNGKLYLVDFGNALLGVKRGEWKNRFNSYKNNKQDNRDILYGWFKLNPDKFKIASEIIASIPDNKINFVLKNALHLKLVNEEEYVGIRDFLVDRKSKLWEVVL